jgi:hypothetical protein
MPFRARKMSCIRQRTSTGVSGSGSAPGKERGDVRAGIRCRFPKCFAVFCNVCFHMLKCFRLPLSFAMGNTGDAIFVKARDLRKRTCCQAPEAHSMRLYVNLSSSNEPKSRRRAAACSGACIYLVLPCFVHPRRRSSQLNTAITTSCHCPFITEPAALSTNSSADLVPLNGGSRLAFSRFPGI